jgi:ATP/maltotriose-dependent transcriptional regulator MalT
MLAWFTAVLAEAYLAAGDAARANEAARRARALARETAFPYGAGLAERALGRLAGARGHHDEAARRLGDALETFRAIDARYEQARTGLDLAALARARGDAPAEQAHLADARRLFQALGIPRDAGESTAA